MGMILAIDQGTTSSRALLFEGGSHVVAMAQQDFQQHYPASGWVEHAPDDLWKTTLFVCQDVIKKAGITAASVAAIGITNQRETTVVWDRQTGRAIHPAIVWQDRRTAATCTSLKAQGQEAMVAAKTGLLLDPYFSATKLAWILDNVKALLKERDPTI